MGHELSNLRTIRSSMVGTERGMYSPDSLPATLEGSIVGQIDDVTRLGLVRRYLSDLRRVLLEMLRVLKPGGAAVLALGPSLITRGEADAGVIVGQLAESVGFENVGWSFRAARGPATLIAAANHSEAGQRAGTPYGGRGIPRAAQTLRGHVSEARCSSSPDASPTLASTATRWPPQISREQTLTPLAELLRALNQACETRAWADEAATDAVLDFVKSPQGFDPLAIIGLELPGTRGSAESDQHHAQRAEAPRTSFALLGCRNS